MDVVVVMYRLFVALLAFVATKEIWLEGDLHGLVFFTNQSNLALGIVLVWAAVASLGRVPQPPVWLKGGVTLFLGITGLISHFVLAPEDPDAPVLFLGLTSGQIEHQITPIAAFADFVLLDRHRRARWSTPLLWLGYLVAYVCFTTVRAELLAEPHYPYGFIDLGELGWGGLAVNVAMYGVGFYALGMVIVTIDRLLPVGPLIGSAGDRGPLAARTSGTVRERDGAGVR
ncbi:Pr6Pr family membrane protein [Actinotalea sp. AC32]|nr:Pr6Pr family membrane protein [Actinotalea sp. AC32]